MNDDINSYFLSKEEPNRSCLLALRSIILQLSDDFTEAYKWRIPCYSYKGKIVCFLNIEKKTNQPYILFANGHKLNHHALEQGDRKRMKILKINPHQDIPTELIQELLRNARQQLSLKK